MQMLATVFSKKLKMIKAFIFLKSNYTQSDFYSISDGEKISKQLLKINKFISAVYLNLNCTIF